MLALLAYFLACLLPPSKANMDDVANKRGVRRALPRTGIVHASGAKCSQQAIGPGGWFQGLFRLLG
jgi:hypothetical protein